MSRKNFVVATDANGQTPKQHTKHTFAIDNNKKDKTPTGKTKTIKDKEVIRKEREEQYKNFRIGALKRRAKRMGLTDAQIEVKVKELINQMDTPNSYFVLIMFNPKDADLLKQALMNEGLTWKIMGANYAYVEADQETLATIREIAPPGAKIHPYVKKKPSILPVMEKSGRGKKTKTKAQKKAAAVAAKVARKEKNIRIHHNKKTGEIEHRSMSERPNRHSNSTKKATKKIVFKTLLAAKKHNTGIVVHMNAKKVSMGLKKASTGIKKAA